MSLRLLLGMLASAFPEQQNYSETMDVSEKVLPSSSEESWIKKFESEELYIAGAAKLHIGMLTISLIVGLAYGGFVSYTYWREKDVFLGYIRNLVIALVCRTFFTIIFDGVVLLGSPFNIGGGNTLSALEQICINLVLGLWLSLTVYAHARVQRNFKSEPTLRLYQFGIPAVAAFFAFVWIFKMQAAFPNFLWWIVSDPFSQWIVHSTNLLFLLIQLGLVGDMCRMMMPMKSSLDNDLVSLLRKAAAMMAALVFIIWLQFGLSLGLYKIEKSYLYFFYFIDGIECTLVCVCFYFFYRWVIPLRNKSPSNDGSGETEITMVDEAEVLPGGRGIVTVDSICVTAESGRWKTSEEESSKDVVYSNVVEPHQLQKTLNLYKRFNVIPNQVTVVDGEQFYDCHIPVESDRVNQKLSPVLPSKDQTLKYNYEKMIEPTQKKNAFYASKYLILDSKKGEIPKYLETRPSVSSKSESPREKEGKKDPFSDFEIVDVVRKWLNDNSENMPQNRRTPLMIKQKELSREDSDLKTSKPSIETTEEDLIVEKLDNNQIQFEQQSSPSIVPGSPADTHIGLELNTENDPRGRTTEPPADARNINNIEGTPTEGVPSQSLNDPVHKLPNKSDLYALAPTILNKPEEKNKPTESTDSYLTYSELLELRSKREKSDEPPANNRNSIFSRVINAGSYFLTSFKGFAQADQTSITDEKQPQTKCEQELQTGEKLVEELRHDEPKPHLDLFSSLPEKEKAAELEDAIRRSESIKKRELTLENEMKNDNFDYQGMQNLELQSSTTDKEQLSQKLKEKESSLSSNLERPSFNWSREQQPQKVMECNREESFEPSSDLNKGQSPQKLTEDEEESLETSSVSEFSIEKETLRRPTGHKEKSLERFSGSTVVTEAYNSDQNLPPQKLTKDEEESLETSSVSEFSIQNETLSRSADDEEKSLERFSGSKVVTEACNSNQNLPLQKLKQDEEDSLETSSVSEFSIEKETLRRPTGHKEKPLERFSGSVLVRQALPPQKPKQYEEESLETSSGSEFSVEKIHSYSSGRLSTSNQKYRHLRTADTATSQPQVTTASNSEVSAERKPSSSSQESFSLENYYNKVLRDRSQLQN